MADTKPDLMERGTRYQHYSELKELFTLGVDILKNLTPAHRSPEDARKQKKLEGAIELIDGRINLLSNFETKGGMCSDLEKTINAIPKMPKVTDEAQASSQPD